MSFQFVLGSSRAKNFKETFEILRDVPIPQLLLKISQEGLKIQAMDSTHISVSKLTFTKSYFTHLQVEEEVTIGIDITILTKLLKAMQPKDGLMWDYKGDKLLIHIDSPSRTQYFHMNLIDIMEDTLDIPTFDKDYTVEICAKYFQKMIQSVSLVEGNNCGLLFNSDNIVMSASGDLGTTELTLSKTMYKDDEDMDKVVDKDNGKLKGKGKEQQCDNNYCDIVKSKGITEDLNNKFSIEFLKRFSRACCLTKNNMRLEFKQDFPLGIVYELPQNSTLQFYIAPKCEE